MVISFDRIAQQFLDYTENQNVQHEPWTSINESVVYLSFGPSLPETRAHIDTINRFFSSH